MNEDCKPRRIRCSKVVKQYNTDHLKRIADMGCGEVYQSLKSSGGIVTRRCMNSKKLAEKLIEKIPGFLPSEPKVGADLKKMQQIHETWIAHLRETIERIGKPVKPVYLTDEVTKVLQEKGSAIRCENVHLEWYLATQRGKVVTPEKVAAAILAYDGTDWLSVKRLVKDDAYNIRVEDEPQSAAEEGQKKRSYIRNRYEAVTKVFEFIWSLPAVPHIDTLEERLMNDLQVVDELAAWRKQDTEDYDYSVKYLEFLGRLQTLPASAKKVKFKSPVPPAKETTEPQTKAKVENKIEAVPKQESVVTQPVQPITPPVASVDASVPDEEPEEPDYVSDLEMTDPLTEESKDIPKTDIPPQAVDKDDQAFEIAKRKFNNQEELDSDDQIAILNRGICARCGSTKGIRHYDTKYKPDGSIEIDRNDNCMNEGCKWRYYYSPEGKIRYKITPLRDRQLIQ